MKIGSSFSVYLVNNLKIYNPNWLTQEGQLLGHKIANVTCRAGFRCVFMCSFEGCEQDLVSPSFCLGIWSSECWNHSNPGFLLRFEGGCSPFILSVLNPVEKKKKSNSPSTDKVKSWA